MKKILTPVSRYVDVIPLINSGADEFYLGISDRLTSMTNKRKHPNANFMNIDILKRTINVIKKCEKKVYLTLNETSYNGSISQIESYLYFLETLDFDGYIVQDFLVLIALQNLEIKKEIHLSSLAQVWNVDSVSFYLENFKGISRIVLPRDITVSEINELIKEFPEIKFEAFLLNEWCYNVDGVCSSVHYQEDNKKFRYLCRREDLYQCKGNFIDSVGFSPAIRNYPSCFVCSVYFFSSMPNLDAYKIVGRGKSVETLMKSVKFLSSVRHFSELSMSFEKFQLKTQNVFHEIYEKNCDAHVCQFSRRQGFFSKRK